MPAQLFDGSLLLGSLARAWLGGGAGSAGVGASTLIHPALVAGWCGLVVTSLNLLPVGGLDGGRMVQASDLLCEPEPPAGLGMMMGKASGVCVGDPVRWLDQALHKGCLSDEGQACLPGVAIEGLKIE